MSISERVTLARVLNNKDVEPHGKPSTYGVQGVPPSGWVWYTLLVKLSCHTTSVCKGCHQVGVTHTYGVVKVPHNEGITHLEDSGRWVTQNQGVMVGATHSRCNGRCHTPKVYRWVPNTQGVPGIAQTSKTLYKLGLARMTYSKTNTRPQCQPSST